VVADIFAIIGSSLLVIAFVVGAAWKLANILRDLAVEVKGHNERLDFHKQLLDDLKKEVKTLQINSERG